VLRECKPPPRRLTSTESDPAFESGFLYIYRIAPHSTTLWIHYVVGFSNFAECRENQLVTMRNANKSPLFRNGGKAIRICVRTTTKN